MLLKESAETTEEQTLLRQQVFERLNTGGVKLSQQEVRNCLYQGELNSVLFDLAANPIFRAAWGMPAFNEAEKANPPIELLENTFYSSMHDVEAVLRFFALRHADHYQQGMQGFLDLYMVRCSKFNTEDLKFLRNLFERTIGLGNAIFGELLYRTWNTKENDWSKKAQVAFADAVMVGLSKNLDQGAVLRQKRQAVLDATKKLFEQHPEGMFTGRGNTKADVNERINLFSQMLQRVSAN